MELLNRDTCEQDNDSEESYVPEVLSDEEESFSDWQEVYGDETSDFTKKLNAARNSTFGPNSNVGRIFVRDVHCQWNESAFRGMHAEMEHEVNESKRTRRIKDRADRATVEQVLDPRTRLVLFRLLQRGIFSSIDGCISTGKEANVYHAVKSDGTSVAVKIYKTSILTFKDRERYVTGEFRYRRGYCKHNPRKMVATWAEKEMRNLMRMYQAGLPVPKPYLLKGHVLVMDFIGDNGWPAPLLKDVHLDSDLAEKLYLQMVLLMRAMYRECRLVHADLSEYNVIIHRDQIIIIDVSQSVEHDHPHSLDFLRCDCANVTKFFRSKGVSVLPLRKLFQVIADPLIRTQNEVDLALTQRTVEAPEDDALFMKAYIVHKLDHVLHFERDTQIAKEGGEVHNPYQTMLTKIEDSEKKVNVESNGEEDSESSNSEEGRSADHLQGRRKEESERKTMYAMLHTRSRDESPGTKKERKRLVKEERRENRLTKTPKHVKKRHERAGKRR